MQCVADLGAVARSRDGGDDGIVSRGLDGAVSICPQRAASRQRLHHRRLRRVLRGPAGFLEPERVEEPREVACAHVVPGVVGDAAALAGGNALDDGAVKVGIFEVDGRAAHRVALRRGGGEPQE